MFGQNRVVPPKHLEAEPKNSLQVTSIFATLQGEGPFAGRPAIFLRLAHCNLQCSFCDTYFDRGERMTFEEIEETIREASDEAFPNNRRYEPMLVVTGGEPYLQAINLREFLLWRRTPRGHFDEQVQIETNGNFYLPMPMHVFVVVSPKVNEKTGMYIKVNRDLLAKVEVLKFVISRHMTAYSYIPEWAFRWRDEEPEFRTIYLSPMNCYTKQPDMPSDLADAKERAAKERISFWTPGLLDLEKNQQNHEYAAALAMKFSCVLSLQQHLYAGLP